MSTWAWPGIVYSVESEVRRPWPAVGKSMFASRERFRRIIAVNH